jgi:hypothetical protein
MKNLSFVRVDGGRNPLPTPTGLALTGLGSLPGGRPPPAGPRNRNYALSEGLKPVLIILKLPRSENGVNEVK